MINHVRTLLMNLDGSTGFTGILGDEILDPDYVARTLPANLQAIRAVLFGATPDRYMLNYRCRQILGALRDTDLEQYIRDQDSRITYRFTDDALFPRTPFVPVITNVGAHAYDIDIQGEREAPDSHGMMHKVWDLTMGTGNITVSLQGTVHSEIVALSGSPAPITLITSPLGALIDTSAPASTQWTIAATARPAYELGSLVSSLDRIGENYIAQLFGVGSAAGAVDPLKSLHNIWKKHKELSYRIGAIAIALAIQTNEVKPV